MSADEFVFGLSYSFTLSGTIGHTGDGDIELTKLTEILQISIHLLIGDDRKGCAIRETLVFVLGQGPAS